MPGGRRGIWIGLLCLLIGSNSLLFAETGAVHVLTVEGVINPITAEYMVDGVTRAEQQQAEAVIIQLDTPGGLDKSMRMIIKTFLSAQVPVVVYVAPSGARAASAGLFITLAAHVAAMAPGTNIGAAHPVALGGGEMDEAMKAKVENDAAAYIRSLAEKRGRNVEWAEKAVRESVSISASEALAQGVIDLVATDLSDLLEQLEGREVSLPGGKRILQVKGKGVKPIPMT
ncbi:MAG: nodulation protein NfeD, partial [Nitrospinota bacterium]